jgi:hypothetical protein
MQAMLPVASMIEPEAVTLDAEEGFPEVTT